MTTLVGKLTEQLTEKGRELTSYKQKHGIRIVDERDMEGKYGSSESASKTAAPGTQGVLLSK